MKKHILLALFFLSSSATFAQKPLVETPYQLDTFNINRARFSVGLQAGVATSVSTGLYFLWYSNYEQSRFHWIDDSYGWLQIDKFGHTFTNYQILGKSYMMNRWAGYNKKQALLIGVGVSYGFQTLIEVFDGLSAAWGASATDIATNTLGMLTFLSQEMLWDEQRIMWKFSFKNGDYSAFDEHVNTRAERLYGTAIYESFLKDYNGQTHWLSINLRSFSNGMEWMPEWLNIAFGYSAEGLLGANWNVWYDQAGCFRDYERIPRYRQYYFSLDIDWERIPTSSRFLKAIAPYLNIVKMPFPALEFSTVDGFKAKAFYF